MRSILVERVHLDLTKMPGDITYLWDSDRPNIWATHEFKVDLLSRLKSINFDPLTDAFALVGGQVAVSLAMTVLQEEYKYYKILVWHAEHRIYVTKYVQPLHERATV